MKSLALRRVGRLVSLLAIIFSSPLAADQLDTVRVGVLSFGTVNWELNVIQEHGLDRQHGIDLEVVPLGSKNAVAVALQGDAVDLIVSDWVWVARQVAEGRSYTFYPHSLMAGGVVVRPDAGISTLADLQGKKLGIAGGPVDKNWLLLRALGRQQLGVDLKDSLEPVFAAPPLLNKLMLKGDLDAVLNFWHFKARLEKAGMQTLIEAPTVLSELGISRPIPLLGWVFSREWAQQNPARLEGFLRASRAAKDIMRDSDAEWQRLQPLTKAKDAALLIRLRDAYRQGIPPASDPGWEPVTAQAFDIMAREGGEKLVGKAKTFSAGVYWKRP